jgi:YbbR domain-containing protein
MKLSPFFERASQKIKEDWIAKIICFVLAMILYLFHQAVSLERKSFVLPLAAHDTGIMTNAEIVQRKVRVTMRGNAKDISLISENDFEAFIDFSRYTQEGTYDIPVQLKTADSLLAIDPLEVRFFPDSVSVDMETLTHKYAPVKAVFHEEPRYGFSLREHSVTPAQVRISGPRSTIEAIKDIDTEGISLADRDTRFSAQVKLVNNSALVHLDGPETVNVSISIMPKGVSRIFTVPVTVANLRENWSAKPRLETLPVDVTGAQLDLEKVTVNDFSAVVDCSSVSQAGEVTLPVTVMLPPRVYLAEGAGEQEITLDITAKEESREPAR